MAAKITKKRVGEMLKAVLLELQQMGGEARLKDILVRVEPKLNLTPHERANYEKSGYVRWESIIHFYSIDCVKAGFLQKSGGKWYLTEQGAQALKLAPEEFIHSAQLKYRAWKGAQSAPPLESVTEQEQPNLVIRQAAYEQASAQARSEIEDYINRLGWIDFQRLVSELLIAMGHHVAFIADKGADGGKDIIAYRDPLGIETPHIRVQVKHRAERTPVQDVRQLHGVLKETGEIGLFVSSGGFTKDALEEAQKMTKHIELIDLARFIQLWEEYYDKLREQGRKLLPLVKISFLAPPVEE